MGMRSFHARLRRDNFEGGMCKERKFRDDRKCDLTFDHELILADQSYSFASLDYGDAYSVPAFTGEVLH